MNSDWKDALGALMGDLPQGDAPAPEETPVSESRQRGRLRVMRDKRRGGKIATIIDGFTIADDRIEARASDIKRSLGCGGSVRDGEILVQGDRLDAVVAFLRTKGYKV